MTTPIQIPKLDPGQLLSSPQRALCGVLDTGNVTPADTNNAYGENIFARWLWVGETGDVTYVKWDGTTQLLKDVPAGIWHPICSIGVMLTGTDATDIVWGD